MHHPQAKMGHGCHTCISNTKYATHNFAQNAKYRKRAQQDCAKVNFKPTLCTAGQGIQITKACFRHGGKAPPICLQDSSECKRCKRGQCVQIGLDLYSWFLVLWPLKPSQQSSRFIITNLYQLYFICSALMLFHKNNFANMRSFQQRSMQVLLNLLQITNRKKFGPKLLC